MAVRKRSTVRSRLTSKGQITLPIALRRQFGLQAGDEVEFEMSDTAAKLRLIKRRTLTELAGILHRPGIRKPTDEELRAAIGRYLKAEDDRSRGG